MAVIHKLLERLWEDYVGLNPQARDIYDRLTASGEKVVNDHIALRSYGHRGVGIDVLAEPFIAGGYRLGGAYDFAAKKLRARNYASSDPAMPKVFISELTLDVCSQELQETVKNLIDQIPSQWHKRNDKCVSGRPWELDFATYRKLADESEYAGWVAAFGFRANHFTVLFNALSKFDSLAALNTFIENAGHPLNSSGGKINGSPQVFLEQSSTLAPNVSVTFDDGVHETPACYYEFARRYRQPDGELFGGFVAGSADKIFQSTDRR